MSEDTRHPIARKRVLYTTPGVDRVTVRRDVTYRTAESGPLTMDVYSPPDAKAGTPLPAVVFVLGFSDLGTRKMVGCAAKEMESFSSWARLTASSGMAAVTYMNSDPENDLHALLRYVRTSSSSLGIDGSRLGVWACSGHGPMALSILMRDGGHGVKCAALCYPYTMDLDASHGVADAAASFRFVNAAAGRTVDDLSSDVPVLFARAGRDAFPGLNESLDRLLAKSVARNLPVAFVNHPEGPHGFDLDHDSDRTRATIRHVLGFLKVHLGAAPG
jgi:acetyl esterase/lipase